MSAEERCEHTELLVSQCAHCRGHVSAEEEVEGERRAFIRANPGWLAALYPGSCANCGDPITVGDPITARVGGDWIGRCCA